MKTTTRLAEEKKRKRNKGGRPQKDLDREQIEMLSEIQCTMEEIAAVMKVDRDTLENRYMSEIENGRQRGKTLLRRAQWHKAIVDANPTMQIWLGKVYLNQTDIEGIKQTCEPEVRRLLRIWADKGDMKKVAVVDDAV